MWVSFALLAALVLIGAAWVVTLRNLFRAALSLGLVLLGIAGLFVLLEAEFLAFVQILVYVGAILTLVVFVIMLTSKVQALPSAASARRGIAAAASLGLFALLAGTTQAMIWPQNPLGEPASAAAIGQQLVTTFVLPFEVISLIFVAAIVGAIAVAASPQKSEIRNPKSEIP